MKNFIVSLKITKNLYKSYSKFKKCASYFWPPNLNLTNDFLTHICITCVLKHGKRGIREQIFFAVMYVHIFHHENSSKLFFRNHWNNLNVRTEFKCEKYFHATNIQELFYGLIWDFQSFYRETFFALCSDPDQLAKCWS